MKHTRTIAQTFTLAASTLALLALAACSNETIDIAQKVDDALTEKQQANADRAVSLEGKTLFGEVMKARFEGAHRAYVTMFDSRLSEDENLYAYSATPSTLTLQLQKISAPDGSGTLLSKGDYIAFWNAESFKQSYITKDLDSWYVTQTTTVTASDGTVYTYTNKTAYAVSESGTTITQTTSGTSKESASDSETALFTDLAGYTEFESDYSASEFTHVVTVTVYKATSAETDDENSVATYEDYAQSFVGATLGESETAYGSTDTDTAEKIKLQETLFEQRYDELSADDWFMVRAAFKPYSYTYAMNADITESYINDDGEISKESTSYDYVLTQHYTSFETAIFINTLAAVPNGLGAALFGCGYGGNLYFIVGSDEYEWHMAGIDTKEKTITFYEITSGSEDDENSTDDTEADTITAAYALSENGDDTVLTLTFESAKGSPISGQTINLKYYAVEAGLNVTE